MPVSLYGVIDMSRVLFSTCLGVLFLGEKINTVKDGILFLDEYVPYSEAIFKSTNELASSIKIVIFPSNRGGYNIKPMTISQKSKELVVNFPKNLWGLHDEELATTSNIPGARFIHLSGFLAATDTLEAAYQLASLALNNIEEKNEQESQ